MRIATTITTFQNGTVSGTILGQELVWFGSEVELSACSSTSLTGTLTLTFPGSESI